MRDYELPLSLPLLTRATGHSHVSRPLPPRDRPSPLRAQEVRLLLIFLLQLLLFSHANDFVVSIHRLTPRFRFGGRGARARYQKSYR